MSNISKINGLNITAATASYVSSSAISGIVTSASYALTASFALNGGGGGSGGTNLGLTYAISLGYLMP